MPDASLSAAQAAAAAQLSIAHLRSRADALLSQHRAVTDRLSDARLRLDSVSDKATQDQPLTLAAVRSARAALDAATRLAVTASSQFDAALVVVGSGDEPLPAAEAAEEAQAHAQRSLAAAATTMSDFEAYATQAVAAVSETAATLSDENARSARIALAGLDSALADCRSRYDNLDFRVLTAPVAGGHTLASTPSTAAMLHVGGGAPLAVPPTPSRAATVMFGKSLQSMRDAAAAVLACKGKLVQVRAREEGLRGQLMQDTSPLLPFLVAPGRGCACDDDCGRHSHTGRPESPLGSRRGCDGGRAAVGASPGGCGKGWQRVCPRRPSVCFLRRWQRGGTLCAIRIDVDVANDGALLDTRHSGRATGLGNWENHGGTIPQGRCARRRVHVLAAAARELTRIDCSGVQRS